MKQHTSTNGDRLVDFKFTTGTVKRIESKEDSTLTAICQVGGHAECSQSISMPNSGTQGVLQHFCKFHQAFNVKIRALKVLFGANKKPPNFMTLLNHAAPDINTLNISRHTHTYHCVTETNLSLSLTPINI